MKSPTPLLLCLLMFRVTSVHAIKKGGLRAGRNEFEGAKTGNKSGGSSQTISTMPSAAPSVAPSDSPTKPAEQGTTDKVEPLTPIDDRSLAPSSAPSNYQLGDLILETEDSIAPEFRKPAKAQLILVPQIVNPLPSPAPSAFELGDPIVETEEFLAPEFRTPSSSPSSSPSDYQLGELVVETEDSIAPEYREPESTELASLFPSSKPSSVPPVSQFPSAAPSEDDPNEPDYSKIFGDWYEVIFPPSTQEGAV